MAMPAPTAPPLRGRAKPGAKACAGGITPGHGGRSGLVGLGSARAQISNMADLVCFSIRSVKRKVTDRIFIFPPPSCRRAAPLPSDPAWRGGEGRHRAGLVAV